MIETHSDLKYLVPPPYQQGSIYPWIIDLEPQEEFHLWLRYSDGVEGVVDLSDVAHSELFKAWNQPGVFEQVEIGEYGEVYWTPNANLCPDSLYIELSERSIDPVHA